MNVAAESRNGVRPVTPPLDLLSTLSPYARAAILAVLLLALLGALAVAARWFTRRRETLRRSAAAAWQSVARSAIVRRAQEQYPRVWQQVSARLSPKGYLGLHLIVGLLLSVSALVFFGTIAEDMLDREELAVFDDTAAHMLRADATPSGLAVFRNVSLAGSPLTIALLGAAVSVFLLVRGNQTLLAGWVAALVGGGVLDWVLKAIFQRTRPETAWLFLHGHSWSFPSGHAMGSLIAYGMVAYLAVLVTRSVSAGVVIVGFATFLVLMIGFSRLYLGVHYFTDVIGGFAAGAVWLSACISGVEVVRRRRLTATREPARRVGP
jgi:membrane-associated phospholipid phosphatase